MVAALLPSMGLLSWRRQLNALRSRSIWQLGIALGLSTVLYFAGVILSDVVRVIFLFYLLPLWTTLAAWIIYRDPITPIKCLVIVLALVGMWLLLGGGSQWPVPHNVGDWCGLFAGMCWGISLVLLRGNSTSNALAMSATSIASASLLSFIAIYLFSAFSIAPSLATPSLHTVLSIIPLTVAFACLFLYPSMIGQIWGAQQLPSATAALLTMTEIIVATISAYFLIGTELSSTSIIGAVVITLTMVLNITFNEH